MKYTTNVAVYHTTREEDMSQSPAVLILAYYSVSNTVQQMQLGIAYLWMRFETGKETEKKFFFKQKFACSFGYS